MLEHVTPREFCWILLGLLYFSRQTPGTCAENITLYPPRIVVEFGGHASVNCSTNLTHMGMGWKGSVPKQENVQLITWTVEKLENWETKPICFVHTNQQLEKTVNITIYKPPDLVSISLQSPDELMFENSSYTLRCDVQNVAPVHLVNVTWYKGHKLVKIENPSNESTMPANKTGTLQIFTQRSDDGVQYRCEAELMLGPEGPQPPLVKTSDPFNITVHYGPEVLNCPAVLQLKEGESLSDYCKVTGKPLPDSRWERDGLNVDPSIPLTMASSGEYKIIVNGDIRNTLTVNVTWHPVSAEVSVSTEGHVGPMTEGENYTLRCDVRNVPPARMLNVTWYKGNYGVKDESLPSPATEYLANETATLAVSPSRNDNITWYRCDVAINMGPESSTKIQSNPFNITVHYKPTIHKASPHLVPVFYGYPEVLVCVASGYPEPTITWIFNNDKFEGENLTVTENPGKYTCVASNPVGNDTRVVNVVMKDAHCELTLRPSELLLEYGASASVDCFTATPVGHLGMGWKAPQGAVDTTRDVQLITWRVDSLVHWDIQPICHLDLFAGRCHEELRVTVYKLPDRVAISSVGHAGPMIEGRQYELQCDVYNVAPVHLLTVNWYKGQHLVQKTFFSDSTKTPVNQSTRFHMSLSIADNGVRYRCEAELKLSGTKAQTASKVASQHLGLTVHYSPQVSSRLETFNETTEGVALNCTVTANPPPTYRWRSTNTGKEFNIGHPVLDLAFLGSGNYTCTASNGIGSISKLFIVRAKPRGGTRTTFWAIVGPFVGLAAVMIAGYVLVKRRTIKK